MWKTEADPLRSGTSPCRVSPQPCPGLPGLFPGFAPLSVRGKEMTDGKEQAALGQVTECPVPGPHVGAEQS